MTQNPLLRWLTQPHVFFGAALLAFWIKFNIVFFTFKPYTLTKLYFPCFFVLLFLYGLEQFKQKRASEPGFVLVVLMLVAFFLPVGYLRYPHSWAVYVKYGASILSFASLYLAGLLLNREQKKTLLGAALAFCALGLFYGLAQHFWDFAYLPGHFRWEARMDRPYGVLDDPDHSSALYLVGLFLVLALALYRNRYLWFLPMAGLFGWAILQSHSMGTYFALVGVAVVALPACLIPFVPGWTENRLFGVLLLFWSSLFLGMLAFYWIFTHDVGGLGVWLLQYKAHLSVAIRLDLMKLAWQVFLESPFFGVGLANDYNPVLIRSLHVTRYTDIFGLHIHTTLLSVLANQGLAGFVPFVLLICLSLRRFARLILKQESLRSRYMILVCFGLFMAIQVQSYSLLQLYSISYWFSLLLPFLLDFTLPALASPQRIRVLFISHCSHLGGAERVLLRFLAQVKGFDPLVLLPPGPLAEQLEKHQVPVRQAWFLGKLNKGKNPLWPLLLVVKLLCFPLEMAYWVLRFRPHLVQSNNYYSLAYALFPSLITGRQLIWHMHDFPRNRMPYAQANSLFAFFSSSAITVSQAVRHDLLEMGMEPGRVHCIYNSLPLPTEVEELQPALKAKMQDFSKDFTLTLGVLASLEERKGIIPVVEALHLAVQEHGINAGLVIAGQAHDKEQEAYQARLEAEIQRLGLQERVLLVGQIGDLKSFFHQIDLLVHYPTEPDPLPTVILEALHLGCPVVAANNGGNPECLNWGEWGLLVHPEAPAHLAQELAHLRHFALNPEQQAAFHQKFSAQAKEEAHLELYRQCLAQIGR